MFNHYKTLRIKTVMVVIISVVITLILMSTISFNAMNAVEANAATDSDKAANLNAMNITSSSYAVMSGSTSEMVIDGHAERKMQPGRIATLVNAMVVIDNMYDDRELENSVDIDAELAEYGDLFKQGESIKVGDLLTAMIVGGDGQAAEALASYSASKRDIFINEMNSKCMQLGIMDTQFSNPKGSYSTKTYSTAADCAVIMQAAIRYEIIKKLFEQKSATVTAVSKDGERDIKITSSNPVLTAGDYKDGRGGICGTLDAPTVSTQYAGVAVKDDMQLIVILMDSNQARVADEARSLLDYASTIVTRNMVVDRDKVAGHVMVRGGSKTRVPAYTEIKGYAYVPPEGSEELVQTDIELYKNLKAPLKKGSKVGEFRIYVADELKGTVDLVTKQNVNRGWFPSWIYISNRTSIVLAVILFLILLFLLRVWQVKRRRAKRKAEKHKTLVRQMAIEQMEIDEDRKRRNWTYGGGYEKMDPRTSDIRKEVLESELAKQAEQANQQKQDKHKKSEKREKRERHKDKKTTK